jgi:hypothetical protein
MKHAKIEAGQLTFTDGRFYPHPETGAWVPSVTTVLEAAPKPYALLQWMKEQGSKTDEVIAAAGRRGTSVHTMTERYDRGEEVTLFNPDGSPACTLEEWAMFERFVEFSRGRLVQWSEIETRYVGHEWAGTVDRVGYVEGVGHCIVDIKTSNGVWETYWQQLAAYHHLVRAARSADKHAIQAVCILWLNAKTRSEGRKGAIQGKGWQLVVLPVGPELTAHLDLFMAYRKVWEATTTAREPKQTTYQLSHRKEGSNVS